MSGGYVLVHVLEVQIPGFDLGECPSCEIILGKTCVPCPVPSTLSSENVALPTDADPEPVIHVRAYSSPQGGAPGPRIGLVVVPVSSLVALEVWNVWYAMDGEGSDDLADQPPELTPKMHLLLQYVSAEAAADESLQLREMRAQDFLLRALQQLNASLEAKVMVNQTGDCAQSSPAADKTLAMGGGFDLDPGSNSAAVEIPTFRDPFLQPTAQATHHLGNIHTAPHSSLPEISPMPQARTEETTPSTQAQRAPSPRPPTAALAEAMRAPMSTPRNIEHGPSAGKVEELVQRRVEPYERVIAAFEDKQKFYDDQESRVQQLARALEEQEHKSQEFYSQLQETSKRCTLEVEQERESARRSLGDRCSLEQQIAELQKEVGLRRAHEDSLQKRVALMENELGMVHQRCALMDTVEERSQSMQQEAVAYREGRSQIEAKLEEKNETLAECREENLRLRQEHTAELIKVRQQLQDETKSAEELREAQEAREDAARDREVETRLRQEKFEEMARHISSLEGELAAGRALLDTERQHRRDVERKFEEQELKSLHSVFDEHRQTIKALRDELAEVRKALEAEQGRFSELQREADGMRHELGKERSQDQDVQEKLLHSSELKLENQRLLQQNDALHAEMDAMRQETIRMTDRFERDFGEHVKNEQSNCQDRTEMQRHAGELRVELAKVQKDLKEVLLVKEQAVKSCASAREAAERSEDLQRGLHQAQEEIRGLIAGRAQLNAEIERLTAKFRNDVLKEGKRGSDLEIMLEERNHEIKLLMYRVQELSSKYNPTRGDAVDAVLAKWVNGYRPAVPFFRLGPGLYLFGRRQVICKIVNEKPVFRVGGGFISFDKFLELYASEELERLLSYDIDEKTGEPKFVEAHKIRQGWEESGVPEEHRERADHGHDHRPKTSSRGQSRTDVSPRAAPRPAEWDDHSHEQRPKSSSRGPRSGERDRGMQSSRFVEEASSARSSRRSLVAF